ncbi:CopG family transcriptional regulator [Hyphococcus luteus]|uniref:CopG family transcriptional regulator n=1 Tax=Hyphococcus luteus TaxID=2058213 RepID=A0A2S7K9R7_9PROT|nr:CopG family transcriptional regulator [Marinicaulis flavus]PQA89237.1 CopG family transcriptional regulator [Marinicaulis flavus]
MTKPRINIHISREAERLLDKAAGPGVTKTSLVDAAIKQLLAPKDDKSETAALVRRLDRMTRQMERLADDGAAQTETLALYVLYYLCITPPLPENSRAGAEALGRQRFEHFIGQVGDRLMGKERYVDSLLAHMGLEETSAPKATTPLEAVQ